MRRILNFLFVCCIASCAFAETRTQFSEASLLDILVAKNAITAEEAEEIKKASSEVPVCEPVSVQSFRTLFISQMRYTYVYHDYSNTPFDVNDESRFNFRRLLPVFIADLTPNSMLMLSLYMPSSTLINTLHYEINLDGDVLAGKLKLGHWCVNFSMEENVNVRSGFSAVRATGDAMRHAPETTAGKAPLAHRSGKVPGSTAVGRNFPSFLQVFTCHAFLSRRWQKSVLFGHACLNDVQKTNTSKHQYFPLKKVPVPFPLPFDKMPYFLNGYHDIFHKGTRTSGSMTKGRPGS